jgi:chromosome segregation protein
VIVKSHQDGVEAIEYLKNQATGRSSFIPMESSRKPRKELPLGEAEVIAPILDVISVKDGYRDIAEYLLSDVVMVRDLQAGLSLYNRNGYYSTLVTTEGEVIDPMGIVTGGSDAPLEAGFLSQRRRIRDLRENLQALESRLPREEEESARLKQEIEQAETKKTLLTVESHRLDIERVRLEVEKGSAERERERITDTVRALTQEQTDLATTLRLLDEEIQRCHSLAQSRAQEKSEREQALVRKQSTFGELRQALEAAEAEVTQSRIRHAALGEKRDHSDANLANRLKLQEETAREIEARRARLADLQRRHGEIEQELAQTEAKLDQCRNELQGLEARLQTDRESYRTISMQLAELSETIKDLRPRGDACQEEKGRIQLALTKQRLELEHLAANLREKYDAALETLAVESVESLPPQAALLEAIDDLRARVERMGDVNLAAIGEYEELTERFAFMSKQKEDLEKSIADLQQTIVKLNRVCRLRFKESFEEINEKFEAIFPRLFRGGRARLVLTDENDYLETGVDIIVQPPGKKLQSITLLSGGEKALTAVSLLFAIFLTKPSPFCFLDEVDAPLDDANIDRFIEMIKEMSAHSQFVLVTHNKKSMQSAEVLYGITMAEPGVSKVVSVHMH